MFRDSRTHTFTSFCPLRLVSISSTACHGEVCPQEAADGSDCGKQLSTHLKLIVRLQAAGGCHVWPSGILCGWSESVELAAMTVPWDCPQHRQLWTFFKDIFALRIQCIRGFGDDALYKFTFYLLTYGASQLHAGGAIANLDMIWYMIWQI